MKSIVLPAGTEHVQFGELAHLIADALWPDAGPDDDSMTNACARINLDAELARAVDSGALPVKDPLTLGPHTYPVGYALKTALVTVDDLQRFVSDRGLSVIVETPERQAAQVTSPSGDDVDDGNWIIKCPAIAQKLGEKQLETTSAQQINASSMCEAVADELRLDPTTHGRQGPRSAHTVRTGGLKGWKFCPPEIVKK